MGLEIWKAKNYQTGRIGSAPPDLASKKRVDTLLNRVHRRIVVCDYGKLVYQASSPAALLVVFRDYIEGHEPLHKAGILHRNISIKNLMINENDDNPPQR